MWAECSCTSMEGLAMIRSDSGDTQYRVRVGASFAWRYLGAGDGAPLSRDDYDALRAFLKERLLPAEFRWLDMRYLVDEAMVSVTIRDAGQDNPDAATHLRAAIDEFLVRREAS